MRYKKGDKVVVEINGLQGTDSISQNKSYFIGNGETNILGSSPILSECYILGKLEDFQPAQEKIKMTVEEKGEFDELKATQNTPYSAMDGVDDDNYPILFEQLFNNGIAELDAVAQFEFARAWEHPELIEVIHENVKKVEVAGYYLWKSDGKCRLVDDFDERNEHYYFTKSEIENINKQPKFKHIDLVAAWEDEE